MSDETQPISVESIEAHRQKIRRMVTARHVAVRRYRSALNMTVLLFAAGVGLTVYTGDPIAGAATGYCAAVLVDLIKEGR
jgi:hypothetical protein